MFAGAVREAVFGNPTVIRRVNAEFVPVSVSQARLHQPAADPEGRILHAAGQSAPAPQGLAVLNGDGQVLAWSLMFDDDAQVQAFLDLALREFRAHPDGSRPFATRRFQSYPSQPGPDMPVERPVKLLPADHGAAGCPAETRLEAGTLEVKVVGRSVDAHGRPATPAVNQEEYAQDRFTVPPGLQEQVAAAVKTAGANRVRLPDGLARLCAMYAYLGQLDVRPISNPAGGEGTVARCELWATRAPGDASDLFRLEGETDVAAVPSGRPDGAVFRHSVRLTWEGFLRMDGIRIRRLTLAARGEEAVSWNSGGPGHRALVAKLPAGHSFHVSGPVRYGLIGTPFAGKMAPAGEAAAPQGGLPPLHELLTPLFLVALPETRAELKLTADQSSRLEPVLAEARGAASALLSERTPDVPQRMQALREPEERRLRTVLEGILTAAQQQRLRQIQLQGQGVFALGDPAVSGALHLTGAQRMDLQRVFQETQQRFSAVQLQAPGPGGPAAMQERMQQIRREQEQRILDVLEPDQLQEWKKLLGKRFHHD